MNQQIELARHYVEHTGVSLFLTGKAGTGKTTFLRNLVNSTYKRHIVLAPTGVAAINAGGVTIHSFFQLPFCPYLPDVKDLVTEYQMPENKRQLRKNKINIIRTLDLLIIDEVSMVRADLLDAVDATLRRYRHNQRPFGGVQLLMIGDVQQLSPVVTEEERPYMEQVYPSPFFFHSKALRQLDYVTIELKTIYRQQDALFVELLNKIRDNHFDKETLDKLNERYIPSYEPPKGTMPPIRLTTHNHQADSVNNAFLQALKGREWILKATVSGSFPENSYPVDEQLKLKEGAQVMFVKNDPQGAFYNGKIGRVKRICSETELLVEDEDGGEIEVRPMDWENIVYEVDSADNQIKQKVNGVFSQIPLRLAWAVTIHKAQGLTFDRVIVDAAQAFSYGQVYVALSRCRSFEGLILSSPISSRCAIGSSDVSEFVARFPDEEEVESNLGKYRQHHFFDKLNELFDFSALQHQVDRLTRFCGEKLPIKQRQTLTTIQSANGISDTLVSVAEKFHLQLMRLSQTATPDDAYLHERVEKACGYFSTQLSLLAEQVLPLTALEVANKALAADYKSLVDDFREVMRPKRNCINCFTDHVFSIDLYQKVKVDAILEQSESDKNRVSEPKKRKVIRQTKSKPTKEPKPPTWILSAERFAEGRSVKDIAKERELTSSTIERHLITALEKGVIDVDLLLDGEEQDLLIAYFLDHRGCGLKETYEHFEAQFPYYKLRAAQYIADTL